MTISDIGGKHQNGTIEQKNDKNQSFWLGARIRFFKNRMSVVSCLILLSIILFACFGNLFAHWNNEDIDWSMLGTVEVDGMPSISNGHYFGVDILGRDLYARMVQASRISLFIGFVVSIISMISGSFFGVLAGYYGAKTDKILIAADQVTKSIPYLIIFIVWQAFFGRSMFQMIIVMVLLNWSAGFFIVRGQVMTLKTKEFVDAARLMGQTNTQIIWRHILPNMIGMIIIYASLFIPDIIMTESIVSFLGVGIQEPTTSWGKLIAEGAETMLMGTTWQFLIPATFFALAQISLYYIGDGLRDALDPKDRI